MHSPRAARKRTGLVGWGIGSALAVATLMVVVAPLGVAAAPVSSILPPYTGSFASPSTSWNAYGCGKGNALTTMRWSASTGAVGFAAATSAKSACPTQGSLGGYGDGSVSGYMQIAVPFKIPSGTHSVQPNWTFAYTGIERYLITRACPKLVAPPTGYASISCSVQATFGFGISTYLYDQTNGSYFPASTYFPGVYNSSYQYNDTNCNSGSCSYSNYSSGNPASVSVTMPYRWYINGTFNGSHTYVLWTNFDAFAYVTASHYRASAAAAALSFHNGATPMRLNSIQVV